jgi:hypothetical protein
VLLENPPSTEVVVDLGRMMTVGRGLELDAAGRFPD